MITKDSKSDRSRLWVGPLLLLAGLVLGMVVRGLVSGPPEVPPENGKVEVTEPPAGPFAPGPDVPIDPGAKLATLSLQVAEADAQVLERIVKKALQDGVIRDRDLVGATVSAGGKDVKAKIRIKGDWTDHVKTDKWSFRVDLGKKTLLGMSRFSIQHPRTRLYTTEWLFMQAALREGLLAPRSRFVYVKVNGRSLGVYYLEEHFTKEMLESQGRRDGPILRFNEDAMWATWLQYDFHHGKPIPRVILPMTEASWADIRAFNEKHLGKVDSLNQRLHRSMGQMRDLQRQIIQGMPTNMPVKRQQLEELQGRTIDDLLDVKATGKMLALYSMFNADHGLAWHQWRFYHDPVQDRLEPVMFDTQPQPGAGKYGLVVFHLWAKGFMKSPYCYEEAFRVMDKFSRPGYVEDFMASVQPEYLRIEQALQAERILPKELKFDYLKNALLRKAAEIRNIIHPHRTANFSCRILGELGVGKDDDVMIEVDAWATTFVPVQVKSFQFSNGSRVPAARAVNSKDPVMQNLRRGADGIALPRDGRHVRFRFPFNARLAYLQEVKAIKDAIRQGSVLDKNAKLKLSVQYGLLSSDETVSEALNVRRLQDPLDAEKGRPKSPSLAQALSLHECLEYDLTSDKFYLREGDFVVQGDLVLPENLVLHSKTNPKKGTVLRFAKDAVMLSTSPMHLQNVQFLPANETDGWAGIVVLNTGERSTWQKITVRSAHSIARGGWQSPGGITFYYAPVDLTHCQILDARGEDALNIYGCDMLLDNVTIDGAASDMFDGDFVTGTVRDCVFKNSVEDGVDVSGSDILVQGCRFQSVGDKCVSAGEKSKVQVKSCVIESAAIGLVAKDLSELRAEDVQIDSVQQFALAVYIKKPEYGPSSIYIQNLKLGKVGRQPYLVQDPCVLKVDDKDIPGTEVDVDELYRLKILGK